MVTLKELTFVQTTRAESAALCRCAPAGLGYDSCQVGAIVLLLEDDTPASPGKETKRTVQICNTGSVVDRFQIDVVGPAREWIRVDPAEINVFPDQSVGVELILTPPRSAEVAAGEVPFALRVMCHEDFEGSVVEEATITVGSFVDFGVRLVPAAKRGRVSTRFNAVVDNRGNAPLRAQLYVTDAEGKLRFALRYKEVEVAPGKGAVVPVKVRPRILRWRGTDVMLPFQVLAAGRREGGVEEHTADGVLTQAALISDAVAKFVMAVVAAVAALLALWFFVLKPSVESEARKQAVIGGDQHSGGSGQASTQPGPSAAAAAAGGASVGEAKISPSPVPGGATDAGALGGGAEGATGDSGEAESLSASPGSGDARGSDEGGTDAGSPFDHRIEVKGAKPSAVFNTQARYTVPQGATLYIRDVLMENVGGDKGVVRLQRDDVVLRELSLETFDDHEMHFDAPLKFSAGEDVVLAVKCESPGSRNAEKGVCTPALLLSGRSVT